MILPKRLFLIFIFFELLCILDAKKCPKGQKVSKIHKNLCEVCSNGYYQPEENTSLQCKPCTKCDNNTGSVIQQECTKETDTVCQCRGDFVPWDSDSSVCKCEIGFGLSHGECSKCKRGFFSAKINTRCTKWKECKSTRVEIPGNTTSDATCNNELINDSIAVKPHTLNKSESTRQKIPPPHKGAQTPMMPTTIVALVSQQPTMEEQLIHIQPSDSGNNNDWIYIILGIAGILLVLAVVSCKMDVIPCWMTKSRGDIQKKDSACRRPVEESGDNSDMSVKLNPQEP